MNSESIWWSVAPLIAVNVYTLCALVIFSFVYKKVPTNEEVQDRHSSVILNKWVREFWMWLTAPVFKVLLWFKVTPNMVSFFGVVGAVFSCVALAQGNIGLGGWFMALGASFDFFDGRLARMTNQGSLGGSFLDSSLDRVSENIALMGISYHYRDSWVFWVVMLIFLGSNLTSYTKAKGEIMGVDYCGGMMQRPERVAYLAMGAIFSPMFAALLYNIAQNWFGEMSFAALVGYLYAVPLVIVAVFSNLASYNRIINIVKLLDNKEKGQKTA